MPIEEIGVYILSEKVRIFLPSYYSPIRKVDFPEIHIFTGFFRVLKVILLQKMDIQD